MLKEELNDENKLDPTIDSSEENKEEHMEMMGEEQKSSEDESKTDLEDEVDELDQILASLEDNADDIQTAVDEVKSSGGGEVEVEKLLSENKKKDELVKELSESVAALQTKIKSLNLDKSDLVYKNAELEAFGGVQDPQLMIVVRNYEKAKAGDKASQGKIKSILSDIWSGIYGSDIEKDKIDSDVDAITDIDSYISKRNPNIEGKKKEGSTPVF